MPAKQGKKQRKFGRNKVKAARYAERNTLRKHKVRRLMRHNRLTRQTAERVWDLGERTPKAER